jgi:hypothetical protein
MNHILAKSHYLHFSRQLSSSNMTLNPPSCGLTSSWDCHYGKTVKGLTYKGKKTFLLWQSLDSCLHFLSSESHLFRVECDNGCGSIIYKQREDNMSFPIERAASITSAAVTAKPKKKIIKIEDVVTIKGEIIRPQLAITMQRSQMNYGVLKPKKSFLDRIITTANKI